MNKCDVHLCADHFELFHTSKILVEDKEVIEEDFKGLGKSR